MTNDEGIIRLKGVMKMKRRFLLICMLVLCFLAPAAVRADGFDPYLISRESADIGVPRLK